MLASCSEVGIESLLRIWTEVDISSNGRLHAPMHLVLEVLLAARALEKNAQLLFRPFGLTPARFNVLNCLSDRPDGVRASDLAQELIVDPSNVTGLLKRMKKEGLVTQLESPDDRRQHIVTLSPKGKAAWTRANAAYVRSLKALDSELTAMERLWCETSVRKLAYSAARLGAEQ
jgi:DNA-binding MarR family transcriptional regulator